MKKIALFCLIAGMGNAWAAGTINSTEKFAYGANIGWINAQGNLQRTR